ncbi:MAG: transposase [Planctomycetes bacterium]|nr:transposase [Planctomycetota bacterium]
MIKRKKNRLPLEVYRGLRAYHLTICAQNAKKVFTNEREIKYHLKTIDNCSRKYNFEILGYCYMPDHVHLLISSVDEKAPLVRFIKDYKQITGYNYRQHNNQVLWQKSYYDHILRKEEDILTVIRYLFKNPVRKGIVDQFSQYPFLGSLKWGKEIFNMIGN